MAAGSALLSAVVFCSVRHACGSFGLFRSCAMKTSPLYIALGVHLLSVLWLGAVSLYGIRRFLGIISVLFLLLPITAQAQTYIFGRADFPVGTSANSIAKGDFNGDGTLDLAVVNEADNTVSILMGKSDGTFAPQVTYATGLGPLAIVTGDFNGDGNLDLAVTNGNCVPTEFGLKCDVLTVSILLGNGDGTFRPHIDYATGTQPSSVAAGDFNGDGKLDLVIANTQDGTVSVLLGNGDGTFQMQVVYPTTPAPASVIVADFNGDHKLDLAVGGSGGVSVLLGNGNGTFQKQLASPGSSPLATADFNGDGRLDLFAGGDVLLGNGDGTFVPHTTYPSGSAAAAADLNGDGKPDLVIAGGGGNNASSTSVAVLLGNGDGTFQPPVQYGTASSPPYLVIADFNGDGKFDLAVADPDCILFSCSTPGAVSILLGFGDGTFVGGKDYSFQSENPASQVISADFNGDGKPDIAAESAFTPNGGPTPVGVFLGNGDGTFQSEVFTSLTQSLGGIAAGDFNGDGKADLATVFSNCSNNTCLPGDAVVLIGNGDGTFQPPVEYTVGLEPENVAVGDFNGDGKPDLAISNFAANTASILLNNGNGTFQSHVDYPTGTNPGPISTGDFRGNGILDLAIVDYDTVSILLGNGNGTFTPGTPVATSTQPQAVVVADFNGDGRLDLALTTSDQVLILLGNGDGTFQTPVGYPDGLDLGVPSVGDFNGDGKPDLIIGSVDGYIASILLGNGDGSFQQPIFNFLSGSLIAVMDFNQDGSPDVAAGTGYGVATVAVSVMLSSPFKSISPASLSFGSQGVGTTGAAQTITISNPSNVSFNIASIAANGNFSQANNCGVSLGLGAHCAVTVSFTPTATGLESGSITVTDSTKISPLAVPLSGTGVNGPFLTPYPSRANFAPQAVGTSSTPAIIMLVNTGNAPLNVNGISVTGADSPDFTQINNCGSSLPAAGSCTFNVTFTPTAAGSRTASIAISDTAPGSPQSINLAGTGLGPIADLGTNSLTFASQNVGTTSAPEIATLTNTGTSALNITGIAASGDFAETNTCNTSLAAGGNCQISVTFAPTATGSRAGGVTIADNASGSPQRIALSGVGAGFAISATAVSPTSVPAGGSATTTVTITSSSGFNHSVALACGSITLNGAAATIDPPTCKFSPSSVTNGSGASALTVITTGPNASLAPVSTRSRGLFYSMCLPILGMALIGPGFRSRKKMLLPISLLCLMISGLLFLAACGGGNGGGGNSGGGIGGTPAGTYTISISGSADSMVNATKVTMTVQ
jgi:hypothetical protein